MITLIQGDKKRFDIQGQSIKAIQFDSTNVRTSGSTAVCNDFGAVDVSIVLYQGGKETTIASGSLQPLAMASGFQNSSWIQSFGLSPVPLLAGGTGSSFQTGMINFGGTINLRGNDKMTVEVRCNSGFLPNSTSNVNASTLVVAGVEGIGLQWVTPKIQYQTIGNNESNFRQNIGDNCTSLHYVNIAESSNLSAVQPISNLRIFSDRYNVNDSLTNLLSKRTQQFQSLSESNSRCSNFQLINQEVDDCRVELDLVPAQVTTGENYVVWSTFDTGEKQVQRAKRSKAKHTAKAMRKLRRNPRG